MNKSTVTPKQLLKKRVANKHLKVAIAECNRNVYNEKDIEPVEIKIDYKKQNKFNVRHKELKEAKYPNPFIIPKRLRISNIKSLPPRKEKPVPFIMDEIRTICDPMFFKIIDGRRTKVLYGIKDYKTNIRDRTLYRADTGYLEDKIIEIEANTFYEGQYFEKISNHIKIIQNSFVLFAEESYKDAKRMQKLADEKSQELANVIYQLEGYSREFVRLKNEFFVILTTYEKLSRYKKFLNNLAPDWWRERNEDISKLGTNVCSTLLIQLQSEEIENVILYKKSALSLAQSQPQIYFEDPTDLINIFDFISRQCLNYMEIDTYYSVNLRKIKSYRNFFKKVIYGKYGDMQDSVEVFRNKVKFLEERADDYQTAFEKILKKEFYRLVASQHYIKLFTCVQYVHTKCFGDQEDPNDTLTTLMYNVERLYFELCMKIECLDNRVVKIATKQIFDEDKNIMKQAHEAEQELKHYSAMCKSLYKSFEPPSRRSR